MMEKKSYSNCSNCAHHPSPVPYIVHESTMARMERANRRLWVLLIIVICFLLATNGAWLWYESQFEDVVTTTTEIEQETSGDGDNYIIGRDLTYGEAASKDYQDDQS